MENIFVFEKTKLWVPEKVNIGNAKIKKWKYINQTKFKNHLIIAHAFHFRHKSLRTLLQTFTPCYIKGLQSIRNP